MRQDIFGILKGARDRGEDLHKVANSLINAGYPPTEIQNALAYLGGGAIGSLSSPSSPTQQSMPLVPKPSQQNRGQTPVSVIKQGAMQQTSQQINQFPQNRPAFPQPQNMQNRPLPTTKQQTLPKKDFPIKLFLLILSLIILIGALAATIIFKDKLVSFLG